MCHELKCCRYKICFMCGFAARGPNLVDHYNSAGGRCPQFEHHVRIADQFEHIVPYLCTQECQSHATGDCNVAAHHWWRNRYHLHRLAEMGLQFLSSLTTKQQEFASRWLNSFVFPKSPVVRLPLAFKPLQINGTRPRLNAALQGVVHMWCTHCENALTKT